MNHSSSLFFFSLLYQLVTERIQLSFKIVDLFLPLRAEAPSLPFWMSLVGWRYTSPSTRYNGEEHQKRNPGSGARKLMKQGKKRTQEKQEKARASQTGKETWDVYRKKQWRELQNPPRDAKRALKRQKGEKETEDRG